jgi:hypothetical protein
MSQFKITRTDGRSNQQVVIDLVCGAEPDTLFPYAALEAALERGSETTFDRRAIQACVRAANRRLLHEHRRILEPVANAGYRLARGPDHTRLGNARQRKADRQLKWAVDTLANARTEEMTSEERNLHTAHLIVAVQVQQATRDLRRHDRLIARLTHDQDQLRAQIAERVEQGGL